MHDILDNIVWHTVCGPHAGFTIGTNTARRYGPGFPAFTAFADPRAPQLDALAAYTEPGERLYCDGWAGPVPPGWCLESESMLLKMVWDAPAPVQQTVATDIVPLDSMHGAQALALFALTRPGPFAPRMLELGRFIGVFDGDRLIAVAGSRQCAGGMREISSVCTHPLFRGQGLATSLILTLVRMNLQDSETPFLRVFSDNALALQMYRKMGFHPYRESVARAFYRDVG